MKTNKNIFNPEKITEQVLLSLTLIGFVASLIYSVKNIIYPTSVNIVLVLPFLFFLTPYLFLKLYALKKIETKMHVIPRFLRDIVDNVESGMDLISSIKNTSNTEYSVLNEDIIKLINQLSWGVEFEKAFLNFASNVGSATLKRDFLLVIKARKVGGHVEKILRELSEKINTENLRNKERKSNLASNTFTGYISFVIFIFIIILIYNSLFIDIGAAVGNAENQNDLVDENTIANDEKLSTYLSLFIFLSYELAILSGFLFGLMQENNIISGAPHVVMLIVITFSGFFFFL